MDSFTTVKVTLRDDTRRLSLSVHSSFDTLSQVLRERYDLPERLSLSIKWIDEDQDQITIASDEDLAEAFACHKRILRLQLGVIDEPSKSLQSTPSVDDALQALSASLGLEVPDVLLQEISQKLKSVAPCAQQVLSSHPEAVQRLAEQVSKGSSISPCSIFKLMKGYRKCSATDSKASENSSEKVVHWGITCDVSGMCPIVGTRFHKIGEDYDLCEEEFNKLSEQEKSNFERIAHPRCRGFAHPCTKFFFCGPQGTTAEAQAAVPEGAYLPDSPLQPGSQGPGVRQLQHALIELGVLHPNSIRFRSGYFGPRTRTSIANLQSGLGVEANGEYTQEVREHLLTLLQAIRYDEKAAPTFQTSQESAEAASVPEAPLSFGNRGANVALLQDALIQVGLMDSNHPFIQWGKGRFGPYTSQIVSLLQQECLKVEPTGVYDEAVRDYLLQKLSVSGCETAQDADIQSARDKYNANTSWGKQAGCGQKRNFCPAKSFFGALQQVAEKALESGKQAYVEAVAKAEAAKAAKDAEASLVEAEAEVASKVEAEVASNVDVGSNMEAEANVKAEEEANIEAEVDANVEAISGDDSVLPDEGTEFVDVEAAEEIMKQAALNERASMLVAMGFTEGEAAEALHATQGSLERAADWLFVTRANAEQETSEQDAVWISEPNLPAEWQEVADDLEDMGFDAEKVKATLLECSGDMKAAVKILVASERETN